MDVGTFVIKALWVAFGVAILLGTYLIIDKILKLIKWKMEYDTSVKKDMEALNEFIHNDD